VAASISAAVGVVAIARGMAVRTLVHRPDASHDRNTPGGFVVVACALGISGLTALGYEVLWTRALEQFTHNSTYAYSAMLATFLLGIALGSAAAARVADRLADPLRALGITELLIGTSVVAALLLYARLDVLIPVAAEAIGGLGSWPRVVLLIFLEALSVLLLTTLLFGATFPLGIRAAVGSLAHVGRRVGDLYTANTVGSIIGALAVGFGLLPLL